MEVTLVPAEDVPFVWDKVVPHLDKCIPYTYGRYELADILEVLLFNDHHLWVAFEENGEVHGAVVTQISEYPRKKCLDMVFCGGVKLALWKDEMLATLQDWAHDHGCDCIESNGRAGWGRIFKNDGYKKITQMYELPVEGY